MRLATYNIHRAVGADGARDPHRIARVIAALEADVIGLQEVDWDDVPSDGASPYEVLHHLPGYAAVDGPNLRDHRGHYGNLLLTRWPVRTLRRHDISVARREPRGVIDADLAGPDGDLRVLVTHLGLRPRERRAQVERIAALLDDKPTLLLGDLNDWMPGAPSLRPLTGRKLPGPASFPARLPLLALDRVVVLSGRFDPAISAHRGALARRASDHLPVVADI
ncbi:MAG: endonuclease/exonuclease/phosphatase family protein [Alphaproteobacteria bacterium]